MIMSLGSFLRNGMQVYNAKIKDGRQVYNATIKDGCVNQRKR